MKHPVSVTTIFLVLFLVTQIFGLYIVSQTIADIDYSVPDRPVINYTDTVAGDRPETVGVSSILYLVVGVTIGTLLILFLAKKRRFNWWKAWFFVAVWIAIAITIGVLTKNPVLSWAIALVLAAWKVYRPNPVTHNLTEILMYPGIAAFLVPILDVLSAVLILILISAYDMYAVWKSKHMVRMAEFTTEANVFPGFSLAYSDKKPKKTAKKGTANVGVLGGGDVAIPLCRSLWEGNESRLRLTAFRSYRCAGSR